MYGTRRLLLPFARFGHALIAPPAPSRFHQYLNSKLESQLKLDWYNEQAVKSEARRQANQPVRLLLRRTVRGGKVTLWYRIKVCGARSCHAAVHAGVET